jgi:hypothetical protein
MKALLRTALVSALFALGRKAWEVYQERQQQPQPPTRRERMSRAIRRR